jgi:hypothetical protein
VRIGKVDGAPARDRVVVPTQRAIEIDEAARGEEVFECAPRFLFDGAPGFIGYWSEIPE